MHEDQLKIDGTEHYTMSIFKSQLDGDGKEDAIITVNRYDFAINTAKQDNRNLNLDKDILSPREKEIIFWSAKGLTCQQIAEQLFISKRTVEAHRKTIMEKTSCLNIIEVVVYGLKERIITLDDL